MIKFMDFVEVLGKNFEYKNITKKINGTPVEIKGYLDIDTYANIVYSIAESCFIDGVYHAENREIARRYAIINYMTDIDLVGIDIAEVFKSTQAGTWYSDIEREIIKLPIWAEVEQAIDNQIASLSKTSFDKLCDNLSVMLDTDISDNLADVKEVLDKLGDIDSKELVKAVTENVIEKTKDK